jgi:DEAD/DEAH box helicase domain-containing protein
MDNFLIYDCETIKVINPKKKEKSFQYCNGWNDYDSMGISVLAFWYKNEIYCEANLENHIPWKGSQKFIQAINENPKIVGFNSKRFDDLLLRANGINIVTNIDLLDEIRLAAYGSKKWDKQPKGFSYSLQNIALANNLEKTGHGENAPVLWQQGKHSQVIEYCKNDVEVTKQIFLKFQSGCLVDPNSKKLLVSRFNFEL